MLPEDPMMLLSVINTQLRDNYNSLDELCDAMDESKTDIITKMASINYKYDSSQNQFK